MKEFSLILLTFLLFSCESELIKEKIVETKIDNLSSSEYYLGDTITINGSGFGSSASDVVLTFISESDTLFILPKDNNVIEWTPVRVKYLNNFDISLKELRIGYANQLYDSIPIVNYTYPKIETSEISSGTYTQGSVDGFADERNVRIVSITKDLLVMKYEVSQRLWSFVYNYNNSPKLNQYFPISNVSWREAILFCNSMSKMYGLDTCYNQEGNEFTFDYMANGWRLPTEAEWEYIAGLSNVDSTQVGQFAWYNMNSGYNVNFIGKKRVDFAGLYDLFGNVWEWCWDDYTMQYQLDNLVDPINPKTNLRKVRRGGSNQDGLIYLRKSNRSIPSNSLISTGFRMVRNK